MGIYESGKAKAPVPEASKKQAMLFLAAIAGLALLLFFASLIAEALKPKPITASFTINPLDTAKEQSTVLKVRVFNPTSGAVDDSVIRIEPIDSASLIVFPTVERIPRIGGNEFREFLFSVRPNPNTKTVPGTYKIRIIFQLGTAEFEQETVLEIKNA